MMAKSHSDKSIRGNRPVQFLAGLLALALILPVLGLERERQALVLHLRVAGDVDSIAMVRELSGHLDGVAEDGYEGVLLEFQAGRLREDLAWRLGAAIDEAQRPVWVWLTGPAGASAGPEQLELAIRAEAAWIDPRIDVAWEGGPEGATLMPEEMDRGRMARERYSSLWVALERRGASTRLAEGLLKPSTPLRARWVVAGECELVDGPVEPGRDAGLLTLVEPLGDGATRGRITPEAAEALRLVDGMERVARQVLRRALGDDVARGLRTSRISVESSLDEHIAQGHRLMAVARAEAALAGDVLGRWIDRDLGKSAYERAVRERAREALAAVERGEASLRAFEALAAEHPEVLRTRAPVQADLPGVEETAARAWAREIEYVRRGLSRTRADAMAQAQG